MSLHRSLVLLILGSAIATAQQPTEAAQPAPNPTPPRPAIQAPPGVPVPGAGAQPAAGAPGLRPANAANAAVAQPGIPIGENKIIEDIIEPKLSGNALAGLYRKYTGRRVIVSKAAADAEFSFVQEATPQDPLTYAEAAELLRKAAVVENFVFQEHPQDPNLDILTLATGGLRPAGIKVDVYNENTPLPDTDIVITYVMALSHVKPDQMLNIFTQIIGQFGAYGSIAAVPNASAVVITEKASLIKSLVELKKSVDVPGSVQSSRFIKVQFADVTEIAATLTELLTAQQSAQSTSGVQRTNPGAPAPNLTVPGAPAIAGQATGSGGAGEDTPVQIIAEPRTSRIFAMGRPVDLLFVEGLVREFDVPSTEKTFLRRKLRFLTVSGFLPIAGEAITRAFSGTGEGGGGGGASGGASTTGGAGASNSRTQSSSRSSFGSGRSSSRSSGSSSSGFGNNSSSGFGGGGSSSFGGGGSSGFGGGGGGGGGGSAFSGSAPSSEPESMLVGRTLLVADNITNSIVAQGPPPALEIIERLLDELDVKPDQVLISTVIGQLTLDKGFDTGVSYLYRGGDVSGGGGGGFPGILPILKNTPGTGGTGGTGGVAATAAQLLDPGSFGASGLTAIGKVDNLNIFIKALQKDSDFTVLSRPTIFTSNNQPGSISSGERIAIPTGSTSFGSSNNASTQIEYQDVVLKLEVQPLVNSDKEITMQISLLNDEQNGTQTIEGGAGGGGDLTVPKISTRELLTTVTVPNNQTVVLGGLIVGRNGKSKSGIPILSDIPYLGYLFGSTTDTTTRSELMVFIQPSIVNNERTLQDSQQDMDSRYKITPDARKFADGNGVLPGPGEIPSVQEKGKGGSSYVAQPAQPTGNSTVKPSIRPTHKR
jgi:general secretion pathway protein D